MSMKRCIALAMGMLLVMAADAQMSIIGPGTPAGDWTTDFDMVQNPGDSAVWTLSIYLSDGLVKFRKNHDPMLTWGDVTFPTGTGILGGSDIPADPGFYLVSFDTSTLAYSFSQGFIGINNTTPNVALDIAGAFAQRTAHLDVTSNSATVPANVGLVNLIGAPTGAVYLETFPGIDGQRLIIHNSNTSGQPASFEGTYDIVAGGTIELVFVNAVGWKITSGGGGSDIFWSQTGATDAISNINAEGFYSQNSTPVFIDPGVLPVPVDFAGTRLMWMPEKSAFRVGTVDGPQWNADSIGTWSFASGFGTLAKGIYSTALGDHTKASGAYSTTLGSNTIASGAYATSLGQTTTASGNVSTAHGLLTTASGPYSSTFGYVTEASGYAATAFGDHTISSLYTATAFGDHTTASGAASTAFGANTMASSHLSVAMGAWNDTIAGSDPIVWIPTDPLLTIGNGTGAGARHNAFAIYKNGNLLAKNPTAVSTDPGSIPIPVSGEGTRMMWIPEKSAFRAGTVVGPQWDADSIGTWSFAGGFGTQAKGIYSTALGGNARALGISSTALGTITTASGNYSTALGLYTTSSGYGSTAFGQSTTAFGNYSTSFGHYTIASGGGSTALGDYTTASGEVSTALGTHTTASGYASAAFGENSIARSYLSVAMGMWNDTIAGSSRDSWVPSDPILTVGNGLGSSLRSNALTIYKNGTLAGKRFDPLMTEPGVVAVPLSGAGTRMMWLTEKSAFRVGTVDGPQWDADSIGTWSFASGFGTRAKGVFSTAFGFRTSASALYSTALGNETTATGLISTALGHFTTASGNVSTALGELTTASGYASTALGFESTASGDFSTALGQQATALGNGSTALGINTIARSYLSVALGMWNDTVAGSSRDSWVPSDPLLTIGNGLGNSFRSNALTIYKNGTLVGKRFDPLITEPGVVAVPMSGAGTRMMWLTDKSAFRVGTVDGAQWNADSIGTWSFASGYNTKAKGLYSVALGYITSASANFSTALGLETKASGYSSTAFGQQTKASGFSSTALGNETTASGDNSTALGTFTTASGYSSTALGSLTTASGHYSTAIGSNTIGRSYLSVALGIWNDTIAGSNPTAWVPTDPLLTVGNGSGAGARQNAMTIYKNGNTDISGYTRLGTVAESSPRIKMKELSSTTAGTNTGTAAIPHGLTSSKIIGVEALVEYSTGSFVPVAYTYAPELNFNYLITASDIIIVNNASTCAGTSICSKPVKVVVTYKE